MKRTILTSLFLVIASLVLAFAGDREIRTWTSEATSSGKVFTAQGYLKEVTDDGKIVILVINGKEKKVEVRRLSSSDQRYVQQAIDKEKPKGTSTTKDAETFIFHDKQLPVLRSVYGVFLGERIESLSKRMKIEYFSPIKKKQDENEYLRKSVVYPMYDLGKEKYSYYKFEAYPDFVKLYFVTPNDDDIANIRVYAVEGRVFKVMVYRKGDQFDLYRRYDETIQKKYDKCEQHGCYCDTTQQNHVAICSVYLKHPEFRDLPFTGAAVSYTYIDMWEIAVENLPTDDFEDRL